MAVKFLPAMAEDWPWSERRLAEFCGVSYMTVNRLGVLSVSQSDTSDTRTDSLGRKQPARKPRKNPDRRNVR